MSWKIFYVMSMTLAILTMFMFHNAPNIMPFVTTIMFILTTGNFIIEEIKKLQK